MLWFLAVLPVFLLCSCLHQPVFDEDGWRRTTSSEDPALVNAPHRDGGRYYNPWLLEKERGFTGLIRWRFSQKFSYTAEEKAYLPRIIPDMKTRVEALGEGDFIAWVGHATFLIRVNGQYWLTDPILSERALVPKRKTPPGISVEDLVALAPHISILVSHNHYDHLDKATITRLPASARVFVPPGLGGYIKELGKTDVTELDWWQEFDCGNGVKLVSLPAQHWSKRLGQEANSSSWASYLLITPAATIYFTGDSGYFVGYKEIRKRYPGIDYAIMPVGAYHPRWFMHYAHMNVNESLDAYQDLGARHYIPSHWGTFALGDEPVGYPALDLRRTIESRRLDPSRFLIMDIGEVLPLARQ